MRAYISRAAEPIRTIDRRTEGKRRDRANAGNAHQPAADRLRADDIENLLGQAGEFPQHRGEDRQQRLD